MANSFQSSRKFTLNCPVCHPTWSTSSLFFPEVIIDSSITVKTLWRQGWNGWSGLLLVAHLLIVLFWSSHHVSWAPVTLPALHKHGTLWSSRFLNNTVLSLVSHNFFSLYCQWDPDNWRRGLTSAHGLTVQSAMVERHIGVHGGGSIGLGCLTSLWLDKKGSGDWRSGCIWRQPGSRTLISETHLSKFLLQNPTCKRSHNLP